MRFACEQCQTKYTIPDERVRGKILKIRCKNCNCQITISEGGVRTARPVESAGGDTIIPTKNSLPDLGEGGDSTMIGGMADFFAAGPGAPAGKSAAADEWFVSVDGSTAGPIPLQELAQRVVAAEATPGREIFVWREGFGEWLPPAQVDDVKLAVQKERRVPAPKPAIAIKPALAPKLEPMSLRTAAPAESVGASLLDDNEDATQIGSLSAPTGPPPGKPERSDLALEAVDFDVVTDLPAPPKPQPRAAPEAPAKPKGPPAFKPPPFPGGPPGPKAPPKSVPPVEAAPVVATGGDMLSSRELMSHHDGEAAPSLQMIDPPTFSDDATGAVTGAAINAALQPQAANPASSRPDGFPMEAASQPPMGGMGGMGGPAAELPGAPAGLLPDAEANLGGSASTKPSPLILAALAVVMVIGVGLTIWVVVKPSKHVVPPQEIADAGPAADAKPVDSEKVAQDAEKAKQQKAKKDDLLGISAEQRDALIDKNQKALSACYGKALKKSPKLAGSSLSVEVTISGKGKIDTVEISAKDKDLDGKLDKCLQKSIKRWKFTKRPDKQAYQVKFALTIDS